MNERLYYEDAYRTSFVAQVTERLTFEGQPAVRLEPFGLLSDIGRSTA